MPGLKSRLLRAFAALPFSLRYEMFYQAARTLGVRSYEVEGGQGAFFGPLYDQSITKTYLATGAWSGEIVTLFTEFFRRHGHGIYFDIGANIGLTAIPIAKSAGVRCVAFEPDPHNCTLLRANIAAHDLRNVLVVNAAAAGEAGILHFARDLYNSGDHRLSDSGDIAVRAIALNDLPHPRAPFAVKIDTQGAEPLVVAGGDRLLARAGLVVCEFWPWGMKRMGLQPEPLTRFAMRNFPRARILRAGMPEGEIPVAEAVGLLSEMPAGEYDSADLVLLRP